MLAAAEARDPQVRRGIHDKILAARDYIEVAPRVVHVRTDCPLPALRRPAAQPHPPTRTALVELADRWNLRSSVNRVLAALAD